MKSATQAATGISCLDEMINESHIAAIAMAYVCIKLSWEDNGLGNKIIALFKEQIAPYFEYGDPPSNADFKLDIVPVREWMLFWEGFKAGRAPETP